MNDLISRKWLMECVDEGWIKFDTEEDKNRYIHLVRDIAPSAEPKTCDDLISRQAAIEAFHTWFRDGFDDDKWWNSTHVLAAIEGLPSAQPENIRCKDCKHLKNGEVKNL